MKGTRSAPAARGATMTNTPRTLAVIKAGDDEERRKNCMPEWRNRWYEMRDHAEKLERENYAFAVALKNIAAIADNQNMQLADGFDQLRDIALAALKG